MTIKKPNKTQKEVSRKRASKPKPAVKTAKKTADKAKTGKGMKTSAGTSKTKVSQKVAKTGSKKKVVKKTAVMAVTKNISSKEAETGIAKKLSPRDKRIHEIKKNLLAQRNTLLTEAEEALNELPGQTIYPDMGDQASAEIDRSFMLRLRGREQRLLKKIEAAIEKIDTGLFGICDVCGEEIDIKRLEARPVTTMCIFCKTEQEEEEKMRGGA